MQVDALMEILRIFTAKSRMDYTFIKDFCAVTVPDLFTIADKRAVMHRFQVHAPKTTLGIMVFC